ncbi:MAG: cation-translocating P-type ATPase [Actinomycetota bacterium]
MSTPGLTSEAARVALARDGPNVLPAPRRTPGVVRFGRQLVHFFALMLWAASGLAYLAGLPELTIAIAVVIVLNALFAFVQEQRADRAADRLRTLLPRQVTVRRDGRRLPITADEVVVGDLLLLDAGDRIPADAEVVVGRHLLVDLSAMTGESEPQPREAGEEVLAGTFVQEGEAEAVVTATGPSTQLADIHRLMSGVRRSVTPLTAELHRVVRTIALLAAGMGGAFFAVSGLLGHSASDGFVFALGVTVALVPEALMPTVTLSLAWGAEQMSRQQVLVRNLEAVETLGSTTFICTDKTGTLTRNEMTVVEAWTPHGRVSGSQPGYDPWGAIHLTVGSDREELLALAVAAARCSVGYVTGTDGAWRAHGDPMEAALDVLARRLGMTEAPAEQEQLVVRRFPFDPHRRRMSVVAGDEVLVKGAPDAVLPISAGDVPGATAAVQRWTARGFRTLAVARRAVGGIVPETAEEAESELQLLGVVALEDPPRVDVRPALDACRDAGIRVAMVTGDHPATAAAIAGEVGLLRSGAPVLVGDDLPDDETELGALLDTDGLVVARVSPEQKLRIATALRARGHVVAMTGDGVNDGPALRAADIGIAMGASGTDVAREAADLVLLDDHFASIVAGVELGRATYLNVRRFLTYHLAGNVAEVTPFIIWALTGGRVPLALGVMQILALDIGTDTLSATALGAERPAGDALRRPPVTGRLLNGTVLRRAFGVLGPTLAACGMAAFFATYAVLGWRPGDTFAAEDRAAASGATFLTVALGQDANAFACRSARRRPGQLGWLSNRLLVGALAIEVGVVLAVLLPPGVASVLEHQAPPVIGWVVALLSTGVVVVVDALDKARLSRAGP